jgi:hypothetical protein
MWPIPAAASWHAYCIRHDEVAAFAPGWAGEFDDPIPLPLGRELVTLTDARAHVFKLRKADQD